MCFTADNNVNMSTSISALQQEASSDRTNTPSVDSKLADYFQDDCKNVYLIELVQVISEAGPVDLMYNSPYPPPTCVATPSSTKLNPKPNAKSLPYTEHALLDQIEMNRDIKYQMQTKLITNILNYDRPVNKRVLVSFRLVKCDLIPGSELECLYKLVPLAFAPEYKSKIYEKEELIIMGDYTDENYGCRLILVSTVANYDLPKNKRHACLQLLNAQYKASKVESVPEEEENLMVKEQTMDMTSIHRLEFALMIANYNFPENERGHSIPKPETNYKAPTVETIPELRDLIVKYIKKLFNLRRYDKYLYKLSRNGTPIRPSHIWKAERKLKIVDEVMLKFNLVHTELADKCYLTPADLEAAEIFETEAAKLAVRARIRILQWRKDGPGRALADALLHKCRRVSLFPFDPEHKDV